MNKSLPNKKDQMNPLIEAMFMTMRGHNIKLLDESEPNKPACTFGSYLNMLRVLAEPSFCDHALQGLEQGSLVVPCGLLDS